MSEIESLRQQITDANASTSDLQGNFYALGSEVSRIEQTIKFAKQRRDSLARDLEQTLEGKQRELGLVDSDSQRLTELAEALASIEPTLAREREEVAKSTQRLLKLRRRRRQLMVIGRALLSRRRCPSNKSKSSRGVRPTQNATLQH